MNNIQHIFDKWETRLATKFSFTLSKVRENTLFKTFGEIQRLLNVLLFIHLFNLILFNGPASTEMNYSRYTDIYFRKGIDSDKMSLKLFLTRKCWDLLGYQADKVIFSKELRCFRWKKSLKEEIDWFGCFQFYRSLNWIIFLIKNLFNTL